MCLWAFDALAWMSWSARTSTPCISQSFRISSSGWMFESLAVGRGGGGGVRPLLSLGRFGWGFGGGTGVVRRVESEEVHLLNVERGDGENFVG